MATFLSTAVFVSAIPSMLLWYKLTNKIGTLKTWRMALLWLGLHGVRGVAMRVLAAFCARQVDIVELAVKSIGRVTGAWRCKPWLGPCGGRLRHGLGSAGGRTDAV